MAVLGVDGWQLGRVGARLAGRAVQLLDAPIGLSADGVRRCDEEARGLLEPFGAAGSVFPAPVRAVGVPMVDALDACAAAWSAQRIATGTAECVGDGTTDTRSRPMRIRW